MPNVFSYPYQLGQSISILGLLGGSFYFYYNFKRNFCKQTVENLIRRRVLNAASDLVLHCLPMSHKNVARLLRVNSFLAFMYAYLFVQSLFLTAPWVGL